MQTTHPLVRFIVYYAAGIFALGFVLGTIRTLLLVPYIGALAAVAAEVPLMLIASWWYSRWLIHRLGISNTATKLLCSGLAAFILLMAAEFAVSVWMFGQTPAQFITNLQTPAGLLGLAGQFLFGLIPVAHSCNYR